MTSGNLKKYFVVGPSWGTGRQAPSLWLATKLKMENCNLENIQWLSIFRDPHKVNKLKRKTEPKGLCFLRNGSLWNRISVHTASRAIGRTNVPCLQRNKRSPTCPIMLLQGKLEYSIISGVDWLHRVIKEYFGVMEVL